MPWSGGGTCAPAARLEPIRDPLEYDYLVDRLARQYAGRGPGRELEDLKQVGRVGLLRAHQTFDRSKGYEFEAWATMDIKREIIKALRKGRPLSVPHATRKAVRDGIPDDASPGRRQTLVAGKVALEAGFIGDHNLEHGTLADMILDHHRDTESPAARLGELLPLVDSLGGRQGQVIKMRCELDGSPSLTFREIADELGLTYHAVYSAYSKGVDALKYRARRLQSAANEDSTKVNGSHSDGVHKPSKNGSVPTPAVRLRKGKLGYCPACGGCYKHKSQVCYDNSCERYKLRPVTTETPETERPAKQTTDTRTPAPPPSTTASASLASPPSAVLVELGVMQQIAASLSMLTPEAAARVLGWAACHFGK